MNDMYPEELEKLIEIAFIDGELTEKRRKILFKKAESLGIDLDEFEMVIDARLYEQTGKKETPTVKTPSKPRQKKAQTPQHVEQTENNFIETVKSDFKQVKNDFKRTGKEMLDESIILHPVKNIRKGINEMWQRIGEGCLLIFAKIIFSPFWLLWKLIKIIFSA